MDGWLIMVRGCEIQWATQFVWRHLHEPVRICAFAMNAAAKLSETSPNYRRTFSRSVPGGCARRLLKREDWETEAKEETFERQRGRLGRWESDFRKLESGKSWRFQVQTEPGYFLPKRRPLAEMNYTEPYITTGFATDGKKKSKKNKKKPFSSKSPRCLQQHWRTMTVTAQQSDSRDPANTHTHTRKCSWWKSLFSNGQQKN